MRWLVLAVCAAAAACGDAAPEAKAPTAEAAPAPAGANPTPSGTSTSTATGTSTPTDAPPELPTACADPSAAICAPPSDYVDRLCAKPHQDLALALFAKSTPFTRMYLRGRLDELVLDEEVLALRFHGVPRGGVVVGSGAGTYDVLRWDGSCSLAVEAEMLSKSKPGRARTSGVKWHRVSTRVGDAIIAASDGVKKAHARRGKECQGAMSGDVSLACQKADQGLTDAVVDYVRGGGSVPTPDAP